MLLIGLVVAATVLCLIGFINALLVPFWSMLECVVCRRHSGIKKASWVALHLLFWSFASFIYSFFVTHSPRLMGYTRKSTAGLIVCFVLVGGVAFFTLDAEEVRQQLSELNIEETLTELALADNQDNPEFQEILKQLQQFQETGEMPSGLDVQNVSFDEDLLNSGGTSESEGTSLRAQAMMAMWDDKMPEATKLIEQAVAMEPENIEHRNSRAEINYAAGKREEATKEWDELIAQLTGRIAFEPESAALYRLRAKCFASKQEYAAAIADMNKAMSLDPANTSYHDELNVIRQNANLPPLATPQQAASTTSKSLRASSPQTKPAPADNVKPEKRKPLPDPGILYKNFRENPFVK